MIAILCMFTVKGYQLAKMNWARFFNTLPISYGWATMSLPVCSVLMILTLLIKIVVTILHFGDDSFTIDMHDPDNEGKEKEEE
jgi:TRAP-type C4-dicarboxylate transport system permease small subunit